MIVTTKRVKQYNSTTKTVVIIDGEPLCIVQGCGRTVSNILAYLDGYDVEISDGRIKNLLTKVREKNGLQTNGAKRHSRNDAK